MVYLSKNAGWKTIRMWIDCQYDNIRKIIKIFLRDFVIDFLIYSIVIENHDETKSKSWLVLCVKKWPWPKIVIIFYLFFHRFGQKGVVIKSVKIWSKIANYGTFLAYFMLKDCIFSKAELPLTYTLKRLHDTFWFLAKWNCLFL